MAAILPPMNSFRDDLGIFEQRLSGEDMLKPIEITPDCSVTVGFLHRMAETLNRIYRAADVLREKADGCSRGFESLL